MKIAQYDFPDDLYYDNTHNWARVEDGVVTQGMTAFGQALAGEIIYVEPVTAGRAVRQGQPLLSVESGKWVGRINATVSGTIVAVNDRLERQPDRVNKDPYGAGWLVQLRPGDLEPDLTRLQRPDSPAYGRLIELERRKYGL
jgi:glycine cleavage system H protein